MTRMIAWVLNAAFLVGCNESKPTVQLRYVKLHPLSKRFTVEFYSDRNVEELYSKDDEIISKRVVCALGSDRNFEVGHKLRFVFRQISSYKRRLVAANRDPLDIYRMEVFMNIRLIAMTTGCSAVTD
jgi:hypothetical protein